MTGHFQNKSNLIFRRTKILPKKYLYTLKMFSLEFGATKESGSRAFIDPDDDEDYEDIPEK